MSELRIGYKWTKSCLVLFSGNTNMYLQVVVLVPTVGSVHRLSFPHPSRLETAHDGSLVSVLAEASAAYVIFKCFLFLMTVSNLHPLFQASAASAREHQHTLFWPSSTLLPSFACSHLTHEEEAVFVLGNSAGQLTAVKMSRVRGFTSVNQLAAPSSVLGRVWTSLTSSLAAQVFAVLP